MSDADCCCEPVLSISEAFDHAQTRARELVREVGLTNLKQLGFAYKVSDTPGHIFIRAPELGEHTQETLAAIGIDQAEQDRLRRAGVTS